MNQGATKSVSQSTIQRTLLRLGLRSRRLVRAPMLTAVHRRRRLEFARQYSSWTSTEWRQVAFSDESRFMLHRTDGRWRIRRETSERNHPATIAGTVQAGGGSIMVWGMFSWHSLGSLIIVEGTMDQYKYASVLADHVHPYMRIVFPQDDGIFQQDNARCHTAASVRAWFEEHQDEFTVLPWPANSPDLNPIEHLWDHLDRVVRAMDPQPRNLAQLATALESAWLNIPENTFRDLCDSLPARLAAVRSAKAIKSAVYHELVVSEMDLVARLAHAAPTIKETPGAFKYVQQLMSHQSVRLHRHTSKSTVNFLKETEQKTGIKAIPFTDIPTKSLDVLPINFCAFGFLKTALSKRCPQTLIGLWKAVQEEWDRLPLLTLQKALLSWKLRCRKIE
ncbi:Transposable element Tcb1 transposase, partial [Stegodyphus mimosarum]